MIMCVFKRAFFDLTTGEAARLLDQHLQRRQVVALCPWPPLLPCQLLMVSHCRTSLALRSLNCKNGHIMLLVLNRY